MKHTLLGLLGLWLAACASPAGPNTLNVYAAASLANAFEEIGAAFETENPGLRVAFNFGGSQTLAAQIVQGAPADVFASASPREMDALLESGLVAPGAPQVFLGNRLALVTPPGNPASLAGLQDLARRGLKIILAAPEVPAGAYSLKVLEKFEAEHGSGYAQSVLTNVVSYENDVRQVAAKLALGEADAGLVYVSDAVAAPELVVIDIPEQDNILAVYPITALGNSANPAGAQAFIDFVLSPAGQAILEKWGFSRAP